MARQLNLDRDKVDQCYDIAGRIVGYAGKFIERHATHQIEEATLLFLGCDFDWNGEPAAGPLVRSLGKERLRLGAAGWFGKALLATKEDVPTTARKILENKLGWDRLGEIPFGNVRSLLQKQAHEAFQKIQLSRRKSSRFFLNGQRSSGPHLAVRFTESRPKRVVERTQEWLKKEPSLVVPRYFPKSWGDFRSTVAALKEMDVVLPLAPFGMPRQALSVLQEGVEAVSADGLYPALTGEVDAQVSLVDFYFVLQLFSRWPVKILSDHVELVEKQHALRREHFIAALILFEQMTKRFRIDPGNVMLHSAPLEGGDLEHWSSSISESQVLREIFSQSILWCRLSEGMDPLFYFGASFTEQDVVEIALGDAPLFFDSSEKWVKRADAWMRQMGGFGKEFSLNTLGKIARQSNLILEQTLKFLDQLERQQLWKGLERNAFKTRLQGVKPVGGETVFQKDRKYYNPLTELLEKK